MSYRNTTQIVFRDALTALLAAFMVIMVVLLTIVGKTANDDTRPPGQLIIEAHWPDDRLVDIDLFVVGPDGEAVGFPHKQGRLFSLLRDDLGNDNDPSGKNYEFMFCRKVIPGRYLVSVLYYANRDKSGDDSPVDVTLVITMKTEYASDVIYSGKVALYRQSQETGVAEIVVDDYGVARATDISDRDDVIFWKHFRSIGNG